MTSPADPPLEVGPGTVAHLGVRMFSRVERLAPAQVCQAGQESKVQCPVSGGLVPATNGVDELRLLLTR